MKDEEKLYQITANNSTYCLGLTQTPLSQKSNLCIFEFPLCSFSPSSDSSSLLQIMNESLPEGIHGNIILCKTRVVNDRELKICVVEDSNGYLVETSPVYNQDYYQHEKDCNNDFFDFF